MSKFKPISELLKSFPALDSLGVALGGRREIPFHQQTQEDDCAPTCLRMVLGYFGKELPLQELREIVGTGAVPAVDVLEAGRWYGLRASAVQVTDLKDLQYLPPASILHWDMRHYVVFKHLTRNGAEIHDPAHFDGRLVPWEELSKHFTGVALVFEPGEEFKPVKGKSPALWYYLKQVLGESGVVTRVIVCSLLLQAFGLALPLFTKFLIDRQCGDASLLTVLGAGLLALVMFNFLTSMLRAYILLHLRTHLDVKLTMSFVEHMMSLPYAFFQKRSTGDLVMRLNSNTTIREVATSSVLAGLLDGGLVVLYLIVLFLVSPFMAWLVLVVALVQATLYVLARKRYLELMAAELAAQAKVQGCEVEMLAGIESLKCAGAESRELRLWSGRFVDALNITLNRGRLSALVESLLASLRLASPLLILWVGAYQVLAENMSLGTLFAINALAGGLLVPFSALVGTALQLTTLRSYIERIDDVLQEDSEQAPGSGDHTHRLGGRIGLENVSFRYGRYTPMVLRDVSIDIQAGQHVAIVGRSGSGKSTLARLLAALYAPTKGRVLYDGVDLEKLDYAWARRQMGFVPQAPYLFGRTIRGNIALSDESISIDDIKEASALAHIREDIENLEALPLAYDTLLDEGGLSLSGGQRQRIALARALVHKPRILVLDEATSHVDAETERAIQEELEKLECTLVVIAHRLSTIVNMDVILMLEDGRIVERGTHEELLALNEKYAKLFRAQLAGV